MTGLRDLLSQSHIVGLSPMDGVTDEAFRLVQLKISKPDLTFTEFVSAEGISRGGVKLYDTLLYSKEERPIIGQLFGKDPESFYKSAVILSELCFDGIDINMGCPAKTVTEHGSGAALIGKPELAIDIIRAVKKGIYDWSSGRVKINDIGLNDKTLEVVKRNQKYSSLDLNREITKPTLSVKTRLGIKDITIDTWIPTLLKEDLDFLTIHGRTLKQGYSGSANWDEIKKVAAMTKGTNTKIFGNGDVTSRSQAVEYCKKYGVDGVLIGRFAMGNPWLFSDYVSTPKDKFSAMLLHAQIFKEVFPNRCFDSLRKHFLLYVSGLKNAKQLRSRIVRLNSIEELLMLEADILSW